MKYTIEAPIWNETMQRFESNVTDTKSKEVIAMGISEIEMEANDRAEIIVAGLKMYYAMYENNTPAESIGVPPVG